MPYYIYSVQPFGQLEKLDQFDNFQAASVRAKALRVDAASQSSSKIKVMFAENEWQAEEMLCQVRTPGPTGDD